MSTNNTGITTIKSMLRAAMNGVAARSIRESGMGYKFVFGVELPRLRDIASEYHTAAATERPDHLRQLARELWQENIRECKMLAIMLHPIDDFDEDIANIWIESLRPEQAEIAQLLAMDLLSHMPQASTLSFQWIADERMMYQLCGFLTLTRLIMNGAQLSPDAEAELRDQAEAAAASSYLPLRKAIQNLMIRI